MEGKPSLFKNPSMNSSSASLSSSMQKSINTSGLIRPSLNVQASVGPGMSIYTASGVTTPAGYKPTQKQWIQSQPMSPRGD